MERDMAFRLLEAAYEERNSNIPWIQSDPNLRTPSDDPRFGAPAPHEPSPVASHEGLGHVMPLTILLSVSAIHVDGT
jgi:hypothetical protein